MTAERERINELFEELVPNYGKADTVAGEIIRAISRVGYRWYNDGDMIGVGYGKETCNPAARYLAAKAGSEVKKAISDIWGMEHSPDYVYEKRMQTLYVKVLAYVEAHPELRTTANNEDMWDYKDKNEDVDDSWDEEDEW